MHKSTETLSITPLADPEQEQQDVEQPEYSPEDLEYIDAAAVAAGNLIVDAIADNKTTQRIVETDEGLRGFVERSFSGGRVTGAFAGDELRNIELTLDNTESGDQHIVSIVHPESAYPQILLDGQPAHPSDIPSVQALLDTIQAERAAEQDATDSQSEYVSDDDKEHDSADRYDLAA